MKLQDLENKKILIVGRGTEGKAAQEFLTTHLKASTIVVIDKKDGEDYLDSQSEYDIAIKSPGVKKELLTIPYTTTTNIFLSNAKGKVIGVTGTKGKSTTSSLICHILKEAGQDAYLAGNIGDSPLILLDKLTESSWTVLELSSFQLSDVTISPHIAVLLMISQEHLDYHGSQQAYVDAKRNILRFQTPPDFAVINRDYLPSLESDIYTEGKVFFVSREREGANGCFIEDKQIFISRNGKKEKIVDVADIRLLGAHNLENVCAAAMAADLAGISKPVLAKALKSFTGLVDRLEFVAQVDGVEYYNDTLATLPDATIQALEALPDTQTLIAGGYDRGLDYSSLGPAIANSKIKTLILFPTTGERIWEAVCKSLSEGSRPERFMVTTMEQAVGIASAEADSGSIVLLSPASASFGIFENYKDRGDQFKKEVRKLGV